MTARPSHTPAPLLSVRNLVTTIAKDQGTVRAVDHVSLDLHEGKALGIVGESGSGKSILAKSILRLLPKSAHVSGRSRVWFQGQDLNQMGEKALNRVRGPGIAMLFQDPMSCLNPVMTIGSQMAESLMHHLGMKKGHALGRCLDLLREVGISDPGHRMRQYPHQLSGGMCQRVALAMALSCRPRMLIADEPTTALDVTVQAQILDLLAQRRAATHMAMILITHDLAMAAGRTDDIAVMYAGRIVEKAPAEHLFSGMRMPYTQALMNAVPRLDHPPHTRLNTIEGHCPDLADLPRGCAFAPRCPRVHPCCTRQAPPLSFDTGKDHVFACWYPVQGRLP